MFYFSDFLEYTKYLSNNYCALLHSFLFASRINDPIAVCFEVPVKISKIFHLFSYSEAIGNICPECDFSELPFPFSLVILICFGLGELNVTLCEI